MIGGILVLVTLVPRTNNESPSLNPSHECGKDLLGLKRPRQPPIWSGSLSAMAIMRAKGTHPFLDGHGGARARPCTRHARCSIIMHS
jgi:hypothetical protein